jgi:hypothetical protein
MEDTFSTSPFIVHDASLIVIASAIGAQNLRELRQALYNVNHESLYHHFWGRFLRPQFDDPEFNNDFASWANHSLHDKVLAERLSMVNPIALDDPEQLRQEVIDIIEERLDDSELLEWQKADYQFNFLHSKLIVMRTDTIINTLSDLEMNLPKMSEGSIYYHFIEARRYNPDRKDDISRWLRTFGPKYERICFNIESFDPFFSSLKRIRQRLHRILVRNHNRTE